MKVALSLIYEARFQNKFPRWVLEEADYTVCMSDDIDSLVGAIIIKQVKGWEVEHFYDFNNLYSTNKKTNVKQSVLILPL